jgi:hypothetical protein
MKNTRRDPAMLVRNEVSAPLAILYLCPLDVFRVQGSGFRV